jgi:hypothetical protein
MAKKERGLLGRLDEASRRFLNDPSKKVKTGRDAPIVDVSEVQPDGTETHLLCRRPLQPARLRASALPSLRWSKRRQTPEEQRQMGVGEAVYKKGIQPLAEKATSFSQKLARDRDAGKDPGRQQRDKAAMLEQWKRDREKDKERGR